ncbi:MAG: Lrp/AsnC ligand binding domain-containing protein [Gemmatimonadetes bacterium]|nr:Lrp/AsnC ligand binding domain-containing protein [Gemmatimonadota bacterium]
MKAYVFINASAGKTLEVVGKVQKIEGVKSVNPCWGPPDIIAVVQVKNERTLNDLVLTRIQRLPGVEQTDTHIVIE